VPDQTIEYQIGLKNKYFTSINYDYRENVFVPSILSTIKDVQENDKALLEVILEPIDDIWKQKAVEDYDKFKKGIIEEKPKDFVDFIFSKIFGLLDSAFKFFDMLLEVKVEEDDKKKKLQIGINKMVTPATRNKTKYDAFATHIRILSQSEDIVRRDQIAKALSIGLGDLSEDNEFIVNKKIQTKVKIHYRKIPWTSRQNILTTKEVGQLIQMPTLHWQNEYPEVENIKTQEVNLPKILFEKGIPIGEVSYKGRKAIANWNVKDKDVNSLPIMYIGTQGSGKTEAIIN
jgi:hypothetical protein